MECHIPESNIGYQLLQKMGWTAGRGLGSRGQGRVDPIRIELKDDALGVGKAREFDTNHIESTSKRKALDSEKQMDESEIQRTEREYRAEKKQAIEKELQQVKRVFYCELCDKQYKKVSEYDQHLQSYDHHHKKRFKDMKETARNSIMNQSEREKKLARERKREEKELKRMQEAMQKKLGQPDQPVTKPSIPTTTTAPNSVPSNGNGGWASTTGGWGQPVTVPVATKTQVPQPSAVLQPSTVLHSSTVTQSSTMPHSSTVHQSSTVTQAPAASPAVQAPKKLAFGLKKNVFQFGMKKK
ncbi:uncharacterized protein EV154DRAFT_494071 [Mucor mucedo]|uniref:uncharacterized protein n=1 Tax=Mucor mucedo TaxID=29922 RepID=UPI0022207579|nr:uncharacterized protein EV154DRAFT_494071 [Mucor mucedo]KAI7895886.1 hypothetical protein EV154DRAFT_494071 [Mucor mucedo]